MQHINPVIYSTNYYTLVTGENESGKTDWCQKQIAKLLRETKDRIIVFDMTGEYNEFVLNNDRAIRGRIPMEIRQYKYTNNEFWCVHRIAMDVEGRETPRLIVYDVSRTMSASWMNGVSCVTDILRHYAIGSVQGRVWFFLNIDPYYRIAEDNGCWAILRDMIKYAKYGVRTVFVSSKYDTKLLDARLRCQRRYSVKIKTFADIGNKTQE